MTRDRLDVVDVLDWEYMARIGELIEQPKSWRDGGVQRFAYRFVSTADVQAQNTMLTDLLCNATHLQSVETVEEILDALAFSLHADKSLLKEYAKQIGIHVKRKSNEEA